MNIDYEVTEPDWTKTCRVCGGQRVLVRGKYPGMRQRNVCPTCMLEKLEDLFSYEAFGIHETVTEKAGEK